MFDPADPICATDTDRTLARASLRGALLRYARDMEAEAVWAPEHRKADLLYEAAHAYSTALRLEAA